MSKTGELYHSADRKSKKHVPVIEFPDSAARDEISDVKLTPFKDT